jgi:hypothetical protein
VSAKTLVVTAFDHRHDPLGAELLASLQNAPRRDFAIGLVRMGSEAAPRRLVEAADLFVQLAKDRADLIATHGFDVSHLGVKARLPTLFPGFDTYVWMDGDTWLQNAEGVRQMVEAAAFADIAAAPEADANYWPHPRPHDYSRRTYRVIYGAAEAALWSPFPIINSGVFAAQAGSPLWDLWREALEDARDRQAGREDPFFSDQTPLHRLICSGRLTLQPLRAVNNWLVHLARPAIDIDAKLVRAPSYPFEAINIVHLAADSKASLYRSLDGREVSFRYSAIRRFLGLDA